MAFDVDVKWDSTLVAGAARPYPYPYPYPLP